jgi:hypothetical protein
MVTVIRHFARLDPVNDGQDIGLAPTTPSHWPGSRRAWSAPIWFRHEAGSWSGAPTSGWLRLRSARGTEPWDGPVRLTVS